MVLDPEVQIRLLPLSVRYQTILRPRNAGEYPFVKHTALDALRLHRRLLVYPQTSDAKGSEEGNQRGGCQDERKHGASVP